MPSVWQDRDLWVDLFRKGIQERHSADLSLYSLYQQFIIPHRQSQVEERIHPTKQSPCDTWSPAATAATFDYAEEEKTPYR